MKIWPILTIVCGTAFCQQAPPPPATPAAPPAQAAESTEPAPPEVDAALRERVDKFYQAFVSGKFSAAFEVVLEENRDDFIGSQKDTYKGCQTGRVAYSENFTKATVTESCKGDWHWHGHTMPVTVPLVSFWKVTDGKWYWYPVKQAVYETPFGKMGTGDPANDGGSNAAPPGLPPDPRALATNILKQVAINKAEVHIDSSKASLQEIEISNGMPGPIRLTVDKVGQPGLSVTAERAELAAKGKARIFVKYDPSDPALSCSDCSKRMEGATLATIRVSPTNQVLDIKIVFDRPAKVAQ